jgi:hypothetical protein
MALIGSAVSKAGEGLDGDDGQVLYSVDFAMFLRSPKSRFCGEDV